MPSHHNICNHINGRNLLMLDPNMQDFIMYITSGINGNPIITCSVIDNNTVKPNLDIEVNNIHYYISVLDGQGNSVHEEQPTDITNFLRFLGAPSDVINCIYDLCYFNGHTTAFITHENNSNRLQQTRNFFFYHRRAFIERALRSGIYGGIQSQFIYWGDVTYGITRDIDTVINTLCANRANTNLIAIGGLALQRKNYQVNHNIQLKWPHPDCDLR